eukprot:scaffold107405_cov30-Tisochrysis_lutea.AAC.1
MRAGSPAGSVSKRSMKARNARVRGSSSAQLHTGANAPMSASFELKSLALPSRAARPFTPASRCVSVVPRSQLRSIASVVSHFHGEFFIGRQADSVGWDDVAEHGHQAERREALGSWRSVVLGVVLKLLQQADILVRRMQERGR